MSALRRAWSRLGRDQRVAEPASVPPTVAALADREPAVVRGVVQSVTATPDGGTAALTAELADPTGSLDVVWLGRRRIGGIEPGIELRVRGRVCRRRGRATMYNPRYEILPAHG